MIRHTLYTPFTFGNRKNNKRTTMAANYFGLCLAAIKRWRERERERRRARERKTIMPWQSSHRGVFSTFLILNPFVGLSPSLTHSFECILSTNNDFHIVCTRVYTAFSSSLSSFLAVAVIVVFVYCYRLAKPNQTLYDHLHFFCRWYGWKMVKYIFTFTETCVTALKFNSSMS